MKSDRVALVVVILFLVGMLIYGFLMVSEYLEYREKFQHQCRSEGGTVVDLKRTDLCITGDGRILPIEVE